jgi:probable F420-dependent oxidoreductase
LSTGGEQLAVDDSGRGLLAKGLACHVGRPQDAAMRDFRFTSNIFGITSGDAFAERCRQAERLGYDTVFAPDHLGAPAPFPLLVAAANATERLRVGTLVLNVPWWNPTLLAREIATTDILTDGRLEVGLGAGHMKWEFDHAGVAWEPFGARADRLDAAIRELERQFTADLPELPGGRSPRPLQRRGFNGSGPPLIVGGTGDRILTIAAEHADIVAIAGAYQVKGKSPGTFRLATAVEADERIRFARSQAGERSTGIEWHVLIQMVVHTEHRRASAEQLSAEFGPDLTVDELLETPFLLIGTVAEMADQLLRHRDRYGFSYITVHEPYLETFAPVIERLRS